MIKILGISASPRRGGNSEVLLDAALSGAKSAGAGIEKIILNELCLKPCQECDACRRGDECVIKDDMRLVYKKVSSSDALIVASPIYFGSLSAQAKIMIDRFQPYWVRKYALKKPASRKRARKGIFLSVGAAGKKTFFNNARSIVRIFFVVLDIKYSGDLFCGGVDGAGDIGGRTAVLKKSFELGAKLAKSFQI